MEERITVISGIVLASVSLITALCVGIRKLHLRRIKSMCCDVELGTPME